jgi:hypothetical protein
MLTLDPRLALDLTARLAACGALVAAFETFAVRREFLRGGAFGPANVASLRPRDAVPRQQPDGWLLPTLLLTAVGYGVVIALGPFSFAGRIALTISLLCRMSIWRRRLLGGDGAEQLTTLTLIATWLAVMPTSSDLRVEFAVAFIGAQLVLAYVTAGIAKVMSPIWRQGQALAGILDTETYGHPTASALLHRSPAIAALLGWSVIAFECAFPILLFSPPWLAVALLGVGLSFHIGCALLMGLNTFLWAFPATYPCILVLSLQIQR